MKLKSLAKAATVCLFGVAGGGVLASPLVSTEAFNFDNNLVPTGWTSYLIPGAPAGGSVSVANKHLEFGSLTQGGIYRSINTTGLVQVQLTYEASIPRNSGPSSFLLNDAWFSNRSTGGSVQAGIGNLNAGFNSSIIFGAPGQPLQYYENKFFSVSNPLPTSFRVTNSFQDGLVTQSVLDVATGTTFLNSQVAVAGFKLADMQNLFLYDSTGSGVTGWIDNVSITTTMAAPTCTPPQVLQGNTCVTPTPTQSLASKIFGLVVGLFSPGTTEQPGKVDGAKDAKNVFSALSSAASGKWASTADGNTTGALELTLASTDGKQKIVSALDAMQVKRGDTVYFYYSGHGQSWASVGGAGETPVNILPNQGYAPSFANNNTSDETIQMGALYDKNASHSDRYLSDDELAAIFLNDPKWVGVRKVFIIDACYGGGFWQTGVSNDFGDLNKLDNVYFLAAAPETMKAHTLTGSGGLGLWTEKALLPALRDIGLGATWSDLQGEIDQNIAAWNATDPDKYINGVWAAKGGLDGDNIYDPAFGFQSISGFSARSNDFDMSAVVFTNVPEPTTALLFITSGLTLIFVQRRRRKEAAFWL